MTDLTEQWKKGELPEGHYYVKDGENMIAEYIDGYFYNNGEPMTSFSGGVDEVLAPVPSYEEWRDLEDDLATCDKDLNNVCEQKEELYEENQQLKELLNECRNKWVCYKPYDRDQLLKRIDEVLR